ncbi:MAG TPA: hypothetical protein EYO59_01435 [Chromatiaceae bacterium]|nr:hypothetical protein [Chromatiaceae bacterium]
MLNEIEYERIEEDIALGKELQDRVAVYFGLEEGCPVHKIKKALFKGTACGAWIEFPEHGLAVGSIVEGSDIDCESHHFDWTGEEDVESFLNKALDEIEREADILWRECNEDDIN